jgi:superfamily II DNA/RNA helicase
MTDSSTDNYPSEPITPSNTPPITEIDPTADADIELEPLVARATVTEQSPLFSDFAIRAEIVRSLAEVGIERTFAIQELTLPIALAGNDLIGQARTGTGKTLGFGVPLLNRLSLPGPAGAAPQALVVAPTRELAVQVSGDLAAAGKHLGARVLTIYGGRAYEPQIEALKRGVEVVVGTPGRLLDLAQQGHLVLGAVQILVLDEADEMLDLGFLPDIEKLMAMLPAKRQTMLFSATMPGPIVILARQFMNQPIQIRAEERDNDKPSIDHVEQFAYRAHALDKTELLAKVLQARDRGLTMIFTRTKRTAAKVADSLVERGFAAAAVHGDLGQGAREQALRAFRSGKVDVLVATDVAARGLDVEGVTHVINYQAPEDEKTYVHRIGRTARAGATGTAITLIDWDDVPRWKLVCDALDLPFHEPVETYSTSPHLFLELGIPTDAGATLPRSSRTRAGLAAEEVEDLGGPSAQRGRSGRGERGSDRGSDRGPARDSAGGGERQPRAERPQRTRNRTRTRGGQTIDATDGTSANDSTPSRPAAAEGSASSETKSRAPRRRRRRGGGANGDAAGGDTATGNTAAVND